LNWRIIRLENKRKIICLLNNLKIYLINIIIQNGV
jgi:hypothetical protein